MTEANQTRLRRYLRLATWGLWGRRRLEVRRELEGNIREMVLEKRLAGYSEDEALTETLLEFGKPELVSVGMTRVYTMPTLIRNALLACCLGTIGLSVLSRSAAQIAATQEGLLPICKTVEVKNKSGQLVTVQNITNDCRLDAETTWVGVSSLTALLKSKGVTVKRDPNGLRLTFPDDKPLLVEMHPKTDAIRKSQIRSFEKSGETYLRTNNLIESIAKGSSLPVYLRGWTNPSLMVGKTSFSIGTPDAPVSARLMHEDMSFTPFSDDYERRLPAPGLGNLYLFPRYQMSDFFRHVIRVPDPPGTVYGTLARYRESPEQSKNTADYAPVRDDGTLELNFPWESIEFVTDYKLLSAQPTNGRYRALLVRFTGRIDPRGPAWQLIRPAQPLSDGVK